MQRFSLAVASLLLVASQVAHGQVIVSTIGEAESEAAHFPTFAESVAVQSFNGGYAPVHGNAERRCSQVVAAPASARSGEFVARGLQDLEVGKEHKILWLPLHGRALAETPMLLRADRIGHPADSLRITEPRPAHTPGRDRTAWMYGYPSLVAFPDTGRWLVVTTAGSDWGCYVLDVAPVQGHDHSR